MNAEAEIKRFKMDLLRKMPFYGDIVMRLPFIANDGIPTARTDGGKIEYNPRFLEGLTPGQRNFVLLHEVFHVLLFHCRRNGDRDRKLWNTAADIVVNNMLTQLIPHMRAVLIPFERPKIGIFASICAGDTAENIYAKLLNDNRGRESGKHTVWVQLNNAWRNTQPVQLTAPDDIILREPGEGPSSGPADGLSETAVLQIIRAAAAANRSSIGSCFVPEQLFGLVESKRIPWQSLLREFFSEELSDEASYTTPERKYLHMDLILPGYGRTEQTLEEVWAFVDSSGSVGKNEMDQFLTQLYRIAKEFKSVFNLCYWDTQVTDVYKKILHENDIFKSLPRHSGGTDINCVYRWLRENRVKPDVMLILTDGYFGPLDRRLFTPSLGKKTILVLSGNIPVNDDMKRIGKIARLQ